MGCLLGHRVIREVFLTAYQTDRFVVNESHVSNREESDESIEEVLQRITMRLYQSLHRALSRLISPLIRISSVFW